MSGGTVWKPTERARHPDHSEHLRPTLIRDRFDCEFRGAIKVKGADDMEAWHVLGPKAGPRASVDSLA